MAQFTTLGGTIATVASPLLLTVVSLFGVGAPQGPNVFPVVTDCTKYVSTTGATAWASNSIGSPSSFGTAVNNQSAGNVICLLPGTYMLSGSGATIFKRPGTSSAWIVYKSYEGLGSVTITWPSSATDPNSDLVMYADVAGDGRYMQFSGLIIDGNHVSKEPIKCKGQSTQDTLSTAIVAAHLRVWGNIIRGGTQNGVAGYACDYLDVEGNLIYNIGYGGAYQSSTTEISGGGGSGISTNTMENADAAAGFHNVFANNIIGGTFDLCPGNRTASPWLTTCANQGNSTSHPTDGNAWTIGGYDAGTTNGTMPTLVVNNVGYVDGGRCSIDNGASNVWQVNNTCFDNEMDSRWPNSGNGDVQDNCWGSGCPANEANTVYINNAVQPYSNATWGWQECSGCTATWWHNVMLNSNTGANGGTAALTTALGDANQIWTMPSPVLGFAHPAPVTPSGLDQMATTPAPWFLGNALALTATSMLINAGVDPTTVTPFASLDTTEQAQIRQFAFTDIVGTPRPQAGRWDVGAYEYPASNPCQAVQWTGGLFNTAGSFAGHAATSYLSMSGNGSVWNNIIHTTTAIQAGAGSITFSSGSTTFAVMGGLEDQAHLAAPDATASYNQTTFAIKLSSTGSSVAVYENGADAVDPGTNPYVASDVFSVVVTASGHFLAQKNGVTFVDWTPGTGVTYPLVGVATIRDSGGSVVNSMLCNAS